MAFGKKKQKKKEVISCETVDDAIELLQGKFGSDTIRLMSNESVDKNVEVFSTGSLWVDSALGVGGLPKGRVVEIMGPEGSGKSSLALHVVAEANKKGDSALYIDTEHALDPSLAKSVGVEMNKLVLSQPGSAEQALSIMELGIKSHKFGVIVLDSVAALVPQKELDGDMGDSTVGLQARLMGQALRKITPLVAKANVLVIFINQIRMKIGVLFGNPETTPGGNALKFYASVRIDIRATKKIKKGDDIIGNQVRVRIIKNKLAVPFKVIETDLIYGHGFNKEQELLTLAYEDEVITMKGSKYYYNKDCFAKSKDDAQKTLRSDPVLFESILSDVKEAGGTSRHKVFSGEGEKDED